MATENKDPAIQPEIDTLTSLNSVMHEHTRLLMESAFVEPDSIPLNRFEAMNKTLDTIKQCSPSIIVPPLVNNKTSLLNRMNIVQLGITLRISDLTRTIEESQRRTDTVPTIDSSKPATSIDEIDKRRRVMVVYGRNTEANKSLFAFLYSIGLDPIEWEEAVALTGQGSPFIGEILDKAFEHSQAALVFLTGDDLVRLGTRYQSPHDPPEEKTLTPQARPNVLFELGMAFGRYPDRTVIVSLGHPRQFSDALGRHVLRLSNAPASRKKLAERLKTAGCPVSIEHKDEWMAIGDFDAATQHPDLNISDKQAGLKVIRRRADPELNATHKPKVWVEIRNDSDTFLEILHKGWESTPGGIHLKYGPTTMQLRLGKTFCPEKEGVDHLYVPPHHVIQVWVQPSAHHDIIDLEQRCEVEGRIGNLTFRVDDRDIKIPV